MTVLHFDEVFETFRYPAGEPHVRLRDGWEYDDGDCLILYNARDWNDLCVLLVANSCLGGWDEEPTFVVPYLPFSRHDRPTDVRDSRPMDLVCELFAPERIKIVTIDPHSEVAGQFASFSQAEVVQQFKKEGLFWNNPVVVIPDAGAAKKAYSWLNGRDVVQALKKRDPHTGELSGFQVIDPDHILRGRDAVIVDDICDGGGTFIGLAKELRRLGVQDLALGVSHGLFTKGTDELIRHFYHIVTLDVYSNVHPWVSTVSTKKLIEEGEFF